MHMLKPEPFVAIQDQILKLYRMTAVGHAAQRYATRVPYLVHIQQVAANSADTATELAAKYNHDEQFVTDTSASAFGHDLIEDVDGIDLNFLLTAGTSSTVSCVIDVLTHRKEQQTRAQYRTQVGWPHEHLSKRLQHLGLPVGEPQPIELTESVRRCVLVIKREDIGFNSNRQKIRTLYARDLAAFVANNPDWAKEIQPSQRRSVLDAARPAFESMLDNRRVKWLEDCVTLARAASEVFPGWSGYETLIKTNGLDQPGTYSLEAMTRDDIQPLSERSLGLSSLPPKTGIDGAAI